MSIDPELVRQVKELKMDFKDKPQPELLIRISNNNKDVNFEVETVTAEFTSLCPLNLFQPDYATISLKYKPDAWLVELKSLKFYFTSYRMCPVFHEDVPAMIMKDLIKLLTPREMEVTGYFTIRGGIKTTVKAEYHR